MVTTATKLASSSWWDDPLTDWTDDEPKRALELLSSAYDERPQIRHVVLRAGLDWRHAPSSVASAWDTWIWALEAAARAGLVFDLISVVLNDASVAQFHSQLRKLIEARSVDVDSRTVARMGTTSESVASKAALLRLGATLEATEAATPTSGLQALFDARAGLPDPRGQVQILVDAMRRTALIEVGGQAMGTGFLVGADLLLTAAHVLDKSHFPPALGEGVAVTAVFDFYAEGRRAPAEIGTRVRVAEFIAGSLPTAAERQGKGGGVVHEDELDFALLRLERSPAGESDGAGRGYYPIDAMIYDFKTAQEVTIVQHPLGGHQVMSRIFAPFVPNQNGTRVTYRGNTLPGSSGSAVVDGRGRLVALHHFGAAATNQGVPISAIAAHLAKGPHRALLLPLASPPSPAPAAVTPPPAAVAPQNDPFTTRAFGKEPFWNRENLRRVVREMIDPTAAKSRVLVIEGGDRAGKSYSFRFLTHLASECERSAELKALARSHGIGTVKLDLDDYMLLPGDRIGSQLIADMLTGLGVAMPDSDPLAQSARTVTGVKQWLRARMRDSKVLWWLFFDSVDRAVLTQGGLGELIFGLGRMIEEDRSIPLRVVVVAGNRRHELPGDFAWAEKDSVGPMTRADAEAWLRAQAAARGRTIDETKLDERLKEKFETGKPVPSAENLALWIVGVLLEIT